MSEDENQEQTIVVKQRPSIDGKTIIIGGGIVALIIFLLFRGGGGSSGVQKDKQPLLFKLRSDGLWLGSQKMTPLDAIARVLAGGRNDALISIAGDVRQGDVDALDLAFQQAGITLRSQQSQSFASVYRRGLGSVA